MKKLKLWWLQKQEQRLRRRLFQCKTVLNNQNITPQCWANHIAWKQVADYDLGINLQKQEALDQSMIIWPWERMEKRLIEAILKLNQRQQAEMLEEVSKRYGSKGGE